jgi:hypothetical protein
MQFPRPLDRVFPHLPSYIKEHPWFFCYVRTMFIFSLLYYLLLLFRFYRYVWLFNCKPTCKDTFFFRVFKMFGRVFNPIIGLVLITY